MPRYIYLSFLLLGWIFYELSGGADFSPDVATEVAVVQEKTAIDVTPLEQARQTRAEETVALAGTPLRDAARGTPEPAANAAAPTAEEAEPQGEALQQLRAGLRSTLPVFTSVTGTGGEQVQTIALTGLSGVARATPPAPTPPTPVQSAVRAPVAADAADADIREVIATRVNMRAGPGTSHDIIERLSGGQSVEILGDNGQGWLRLRTLPGDRVGWISERLISPAQD